MQARTSVGAIVTIVLCALSLTNAAFPHIMRAHFLRVVTLPVAVIWMVGITVGAAQLPHHPWALRPILDGGSIYFIALTVVQTARTYRHVLQRTPSPDLASTGPAPH
jgi:hypothetical protein